jgi:hypothetical protein
MSEPDEFVGDLAERLRPVADGRSAAADALRKAVLNQTVGVIRFRRRLNKSILAASLVVCYLAGVATMSLRSPASTTVSRPSNTQTTVDQSPPTLQESLAPEMAKDSLKSQSGPPNLENKQATRPKLARDEILCRQGDRSLADGNLKQAIRRYQLALNLAPADRRAIAPEQDTWLLMALKNARTKEITHDRVQP